MGRRVIVADYMENGLWVATKGNSRLDHVITKAYACWRRVIDRCKVGGSEQKRRPTYIGCTMSENFKNFQFFAEWCNTQVGYKEVGFQLDKDLLFKKNKEYSEQTCVFLPKIINLTLTKSDAIRGQYPIGVSFDKSKNKYKVIVGSGVGRKSRAIGSYDNLDDAFKAYKSFKEARMKSLAEEWQQKIDRRAYEALLNYEVHYDD